MVSERLMFQNKYSKFSMKCQSNHIVWEDHKSQYSEALPHTAKNPCLLTSLQKENLNILCFIYMLKYKFHLVYEVEWYDTTIVLINDKAFILRERELPCYEYSLEKSTEANSQHQLDSYVREPFWKQTLYHVRLSDVCTDQHLDCSLRSNLEPEFPQNHFRILDHRNYI